MRPHGVIAVVPLRQGTLSLSNRIAIYLNPSSGTEKRDYLFPSNRIIKNVLEDGSDLTIGKSTDIFIPTYSVHLDFNLTNSRTSE